jgi:hypothetical protein
MYQRRRLIVEDPYNTTAGKVSASVLPQFFQMFSTSARGRSCQTEGTGSAPVSECRDKSVMTFEPDNDTITEMTISDFLFMGCLS